MTFVELHERIAADRYDDAEPIYQDQQTELYYVGDGLGHLLVGTVGAYREKWGL